MTCVVTGRMTRSHFCSNSNMASVNEDSEKKERNILCLFDVDGTVTPARQVENEWN